MRPQLVSAIAGLLALATVRCGGDDEGDRCAPGTWWNGTQCVTAEADADADIDADVDADIDADIDSDAELDSDPDEPAGPRTGRPCADHADCGLEPPYHMCALEIMELAFPGGYCTVDRCDELGVECPPGSGCAELEVATGLVVYFCMRTCRDGADCREAEGYRCDRGLCVP